MMKYIFILACIIFYNNYTAAQLSDIELVLPTGHTDAILGIDYSEDEKYILSFSKDQFVKVWETKTGFERASINNIQDQILDALFIDGYIATISADFKLTFWNWRINKVILEQHLNSLPIKLTKLDDQTLIIGTMNGSVILFDLTKKKIINSLKVYDKPISAFQPITNQQLIIGDWDGNICLYDIKKKKKVKTYAKRNHQIKDFAFAKDKNQFYSVDSSGIYQWQLEEDDPVKNIDPLNAPINKLALSPDGEKLAGASDDFNIYVWNTKNILSPPSIFESHKNWVSDLIFSTNGDLVSCSWDESTLFWNIQSPQPIKKIYRLTSEVKAMEIDKAGRYLLTGSKEGELRVTDLSLGRQQTVYPLHSSWITDVEFSKNEDYILTTSLDNSIIRIKSGSPDSVKTIEVSGEEGISNGLFIDDKNEILFSSGNQLFKGNFHKASYQKWSSVFSSEVTQIVWIPKRKELITLAGSKAYRINEFGEKTDSISTGGFLSDLAYIPELQSILLACWDGLIYSWHLPSQKINLKYTGHKARITSLAFNEEKKQFITADAQGKVSLWDLENPKSKFSTTPHLKEINTLIFHENIIISSSKDYQLKFLKPFFLRDIATFIPFRNEQFITIIPNNYYSASNQKALFENTGFRIYDQTFPLQYMDAQLNRPHEILIAMPKSNPLLKKSFNLAYKKRLDDLGLEESFEFHVEIPSLKIKNDTKISKATNDKNIKIEFFASDNISPIKQIELFINNISQKVYLATDNKKSVSGFFDIHLATGLNQIKLIATNELGNHSFPSIIDITKLPDTPAEKKPNLYLLTIGVSEYQDQELNPFTPAKKNATAFENVFKYKNKYFSQILTKTLTNEEASKKNINEAFRFFHNATIDDIIIIYFSGHGIIDKDYNYFLGPSDLNLSNIDATGLKFEDFEKKLTATKPIKKLAIIDASYSGLLNTDERKKLNSKAIINKKTSERKSSRGPNFSNLLFVDLQNNYQSLPILAATSGAEEVVKISGNSESLFTSFLIQGLTDKTFDKNKDGNIYLDELLPLLKSHVMETSNGRQSPEWRSFNPLCNFRIW